jgi:hypothetical protein
MPVDSVQRSATSGDGQAEHGQRVGQGLDPGVTEPEGRPSAIRGAGGLCDPLEDWTRKDSSALVNTYSPRQPVVAVTGSGLQDGQVVFRPRLQPRPAGSLQRTSILRARVFLQVDLDPKNIRR